MKIHYALKKYIPALLIVAILATGFFGVFGVDVVNAQSIITNPYVNPGGAAVASALEAWIKAGFNEKVNSMLAAGGSVIMGFFGMILGIGGVLLNISIDFTVLEMGANVKKVTAITEGWKIFRDLANIILIFVLLFIGIATILRLEQYNTKKLLVMLITVALLINFSLFFTKVVIDSSNILAAQFYKQAENVGKDPRNWPESWTGKWNGIADSYKQAFRLTTVYDNTGKVATAELLSLGLTWYQIILVSLLSSILFLIATFALVAGAFLLIIRYVVLIFIMVFSPLAFVGMILPATAGYARQWWNALFKYAFFAPAYLLLTWFVIKLINSPAFQEGIGLTNNAAFANVVKKGADAVETIPLFLNFFIAIAFIIASVLIASKFGIWGSNAVISWGQSARKWGQGVVGRNTVGRGSRLLGNLYDKGQAKMEKTTAGRVGRRVISGLSLGALSDKSIKGAFKAGEKAKFGSKESLEEETKEFRARRKEIQGKIRESEQKRAAKEASSPTFAKLPRDEQNRIINTIDKMHIKELEKPGVKKYLENKSVAEHLSSEQLEAISKSDEFTQQEIENIKKARFANVIDSVKIGDRKALRALSDKEIEMLGDEQLRTDAIIEGLSQSQITAIKKSGKLNSNLKQHVLARRENYLRNAVVLNVELPEMSPPDIAELPSSILTRRDAIKHYSPAVLTELAKKTKLADRNTIRNEIRSWKAAITAGTATEVQRRSYEWLEDPSVKPAGIIF